MRLRLMAAAFLAILGSGPAFAQFVTFPVPSSEYTGSTTVMAISGANLSTTTELSDGTETLTYSSSLEVRTVPGSWATWNSPPATESGTPRVLARGSLSTLTITLSPPRTTFGFELEPNAGTVDVTTTYFNGTTSLGSITRSVSGSSGARLFAAATALPITRVEITVPDTASGFAMAQFRYAAPSIPTLSASMLIGLAAVLLLVGVRLTARC